MVHVLQTEVVVVLVVLTEKCCTAFDCSPSGCVERESHVVTSSGPRKNVDRVMRLSVYLLVIRSQRNHVAFITAFDHLPLHEVHDVYKVLSDEMIFFEKQKKPAEVPCEAQLVENEVQLPPPVMLHLSEFGLAVVSVHVGMVLVVTIYLTRFFLGEISRAITRIVSRKSQRMSLNRVRVEDLRVHAKVNRLPKCIVDRFIVNIVGNYQQCFRNELCRTQTINQTKEIRESVVDLNGDQSCLVGDWPEKVKVVDLRV